MQMESFKELKRHLNWLGVWRVDTGVKENKLCVIKNCVVLSVLLIYFLPTTWFRLFSAQSIRDCAESSHFALASLLCIVWYSTLLWQREKYAAIFNELDAKIEQSE